MTVSSSSSPGLEQAVELAPSYALPLALCGLAIPVLFASQGWALAVAVFSLFLIYQTTVIRLVFAEQALEVYRGSQRIRQFPYAEWQSWRIFWPPVPILFYFREVNSIHFLPVIFDPAQLQRCLQARVGSLAA